MNVVQTCLHLLPFSVMQQEIVGDPRIGVIIRVNTVISDNIYLLYKVWCVNVNQTHKHFRRKSFIINVTDATQNFACFLLCITCVL